MFLQRCQHIWPRTAAVNHAATQRERERQTATFIDDRVGCGRELVRWHIGGGGEALVYGHGRFRTLSLD